MLKKREELLLCQHLLNLDSCGQKLGVVDHTVATVVHVLHDRLYFLFRHLARLILFKGLLKLRETDHACPIGVYFLKSLPQVRDLSLVKHLDKNIHGFSLQLRASFVLTQGVQGAYVKRLLRGAVLEHLFKPLVLESLRTGETCRFIVAEQLRDEVFRAGSDCLKLCVLEVKSGLAYLRINLCLILAEEGQVTRQHDVHDDTQAPAVAFLAVVALEHLWGQIIWRADHCGEFGPPPIL